MGSAFGITEPRIFTRPLRKLTPKTSRGFEVIDFARDLLNVHLTPWQEWLLIHMLELNSDGTMRFRKALVIVGRQNGKTLLGAVLAAFWLYVDAGRWPGVLPEEKFIVVGAAQKLDISLKPWTQVRNWGAPDDVKVGISPERVPVLQSFTYPPRLRSGEVALRTLRGAEYLPRTYDGARGHSAARLLLDELRQQHDFDGWAAIEKSANAMYDSLLVAFSNAGTARSTVLKGVRDAAHASVDDPDAQWFVAEWSADPDAELDDPLAFRQANPSAGYLPGMTISGLMRAAADAPDKNVERIEVLGQWVTSEVTPYLGPAAWSECADAPEIDERGVIVYEGSKVAPSSRRVLGVDVSGDRKMSYVGVAGFRADELAHVEVIAQRPGMMWVVDYCEQVRAKTGITEVALQGRGCAAADLIEPLKKAGFTVHEIVGTQMLNVAGRMNDSVRDGMVRHRNQPALNLAAENGTTKNLSGMPIWDREKAPVDVAPIVAVSMALYALLAIEGEPPAESAYEDHDLLVV